MPSSFRRALLAAAAMAVVSVPSTALGFCRTTTCGPGQCSANPSCEFCLEGGRPLFWGGRCISFGVQAAGSPLRGVDFETTRNVIGSAYAKWMSVDCGGAPPDLELRDFGAINCGRQEYNQTAGNANVWMFRDDYWPYSGANATLALTTITFNVKTGEIFDADVEINSIQNPITLGDTNIQADLDSIVTHEAGHFLGLSHSCEKDATMFASYKLGEVDCAPWKPTTLLGSALCSHQGRIRAASQPPATGSRQNAATPVASARAKARPKVAARRLPVGRRALDAGLRLCCFLESLWGSRGDDVVTSLFDGRAQWGRTRTGLGGRRGAIAFCLDFGFRSGDWCSRGRVL